MWAPGEVVLGVYEVREVIRTGGMGLVHRVRHREWDVDLAVKTPRPERVASPADLADFENEADAWVRLGAHPHLVNCVYVRRIEGLPRVFAEWVDGGTLADAVRGRRLYRGGRGAALGRILDVAVQAAWGLEHAHRRGLVHQDVKPANLMMAGDGTVKVTDFGLARARPSTAGPDAAGQGTDPSVTFAGMTVAYCSPEQARGERLSAASDVWSWAVSVWEMFAGGPPSRFGQAAARVFEQFLMARTDDPVVPSMPEALTETVRRCFATDPADRPAGFGEIARELTEMFADATGEPYAREQPTEAQLLADGLSNHALSLLDLGDPERADELWDRALQAEPRHPHATYNRGLRRWRGGAMTDRDLIADLEGVRAGQGGREIGPYLLALIHIERGDRDSAVRLLGELPDTPDVVAARAEADRLAPARPPAVLQRSTLMRRPVFAVSADGHLAVVSHRMRDLRVWDLDMVRPVRVLAGHEAPVQSVAMSADGQVVVSADESGRILLWDITDGRCRRRWSLPSQGVESVALSDDAGTVAVSGADGSVRLLGDTVRLLSEPFENHGHSFGAALTVVAGGERVAAFDGHRWLLRMWDVRSGELLGGMDRLNRRFAFSADGRHALALTEGDTVRLIDLTTMAVRDLGSSEAWGGGPVAVSGDGRIALSTDYRFGLQQWLLEGNRCLSTVEDARGSEAAVSADGRVALLSIPDGESVGVVRPAPAGPAAPWSYARPGAPSHLIEDARTAAAGLERAAALLDTGHTAQAFEQLQAVRALPGYRRHPRLLPLWHRAGAPGRRSVFAGAWRTRTYQRLARGPAAFTPDLRQVVAGSYFGVVTVHDLRTGQAAQADEEHGAEVRQTVLCADGRHALTTDTRGRHMVWDLATARRTATLHRPDGAPLQLDPPDGPLTLSHHGGGLSILWDRSAQRPLHAFPGPGDRTAVVSGDVLVTVTDDGRTEVFDTRDGRALLTARLPLSGDTLRAVATPDGRVVAAAHGPFSTPGIVWVCHADLPRVLELTAGADAVTCLALTPDGTLLLTGTLDHTVRLWDARTGSLVCSLEGNTTPVFGVALSADGCHAASCDNVGTVLCWDLDWEYTRPPG
ncbi:WD40 repeat domain-containing serine/threonine protein kinase [Streptomyces sp. NPDC093094]|uniref:WD40 repeat domain-containing serine/threonine protein kinase n=1 Tax=Streptomyces sp. NPDC093094 TaxID=3366026 RepID=UPI00380712C9